MRYHASTIVTLTLLLAAGVAVSAKPITKAEAEKVLKAHGGTGAMGTTKDANQAGPLDTKTILYYVAEYKRDRAEGFVIAPADDEMPPLLAFSKDRPFDNKKSSLIKRFMNKDMERRLASLWKKDRAVSAEEAAERARNRAAWAAILNDEVRGLEEPKNWIPDMRVYPLVGSNWAQKRIGDKDVFSLYTPEVQDSEGSGNMVHTPCGCVATAMAQLMRYHQWPNKEVGQHAFTCKVDGQERELTTRGGDGNGGAYKWKQMPLIPDENLTSTQSEMIGAICSDAGISVGMDYREISSSANTLKCADALKNVFNYSNAMTDYDDNESLTNKSDFYRKINANLDARLPVLMGILGDIGHAVVCDGYGYNEKGTHYHHINLGWAGTDNAWYNLADKGVNTPNHQFDTISKLVYNITKSGNGECIGGRVLNGGEAVQDAKVQLEGTTYSTTTDALGIFGFSAIPSNTYKIKVTKKGLTFPLSNVTVGTSQNNGTTGNVWPLDIAAGTATGKLVITEQPKSIIIPKNSSTSLSVKVKGSGEFSYQWYHGQKGDTDDVIEGATSSTYTTPKLKTTTSYWVRVDNGQSTVDSNTAVVTIKGSGNDNPSTLPDPVKNGGFEQGNASWKGDTKVIRKGTDENPAAEGERFAFFGGTGKQGTQALTQNITFPQDLSKATLSFQIHIKTKEPKNGKPADVLEVILVGGDGWQASRRAIATFTNLQANEDYELREIDVTEFKGQTLALRFRCKENDGKPTSFSVDNVSVKLEQ